MDCRFLLKQQKTGNPRKDPNTGYMMSHSLTSTDVTRAQDQKRSEIPAYPRYSPMEDKKQYYQVTPMGLKSLF